MTVSAKIIAASTSKQGKNIVTYELEYPRFIHAEFMTHRLFSRNAASSRAIPIEKMLKLVSENPACPEVWGRNQPGMQAENTFEGVRAVACAWAWKQAAKTAVVSATLLHKMGLHKQIVNRVLEPFSHIKVVLTTTEISNWNWLRDHKDAQPEIKILAQKMNEALNEATFKILEPGEWHVPYYGDGYWDGSGEESLEEALAISSSCSAQVSYRVLDASLEKAESIFSRLIESEPVHASPFEHQATPIDYSVGANNPTRPGTWQKGITHLHKTQGLGSGNFYGFIQHRQLIDNHCKW